MRKNTLSKPVAAMLVAALVALAPVALAQDKAAEKPADPKPAAATTAKVDANAPKMVLAEESHDVGIVPKGETFKHTFVVKNTGKSDLLITDVKPACGCTVPEFDKTIKPGGEGKVTLSIDTKSQPGGPLSKTALIVTNDPTTPQITVFLKANVKPYVEANGLFRIQALTGEAGSGEVILTSDEPDFKPTKVDVSQSFLKARLEPVPEKERIANKNPNQYKVILTSDATAPEGMIGGTAKVQTGVKKQPELDINIYGVIKSSVSVTPLSINFGNFDPKGDAVKRNVTLVNNNTKNGGFAVTKVETSVPGITAEIKPVENDKTRVTVQLTVDQNIKKGVFDGELKVKTNDANRSEIKVPLKGVIL